MLKSSFLFSILFVSSVCSAMNRHEQYSIQSDKNTVLTESNWISFSVDIEKTIKSTIDLDVSKAPAMKMLNLEGVSEPFCLLLANKREDILQFSELFEYFDKTCTKGLIKSEAGKGINTSTVRIRINSTTEEQVIKKHDKNDDDLDAAIVTCDSEVFDPSVCLLTSDISNDEVRVGLFQLSTETNKYTFVSGLLPYVSNFVKKMYDRKKKQESELIVKSEDEKSAKHNYCGLTFAMDNYVCKNEGSRASIEDFYHNEIITFFSFNKYETRLRIHESRCEKQITLYVDNDDITKNAVPITSDAKYCHLYSFKDGVLSDKVIYMPVGHDAHEGDVCLHRSFSD